jgi:O-antigen/teichoic acid export membrane protein
MPMNRRERYYTKANSNTLLGVVSTGLSVVLSAAIMPLLIVRFGADNWARYAFFLLYVAVLTFVESALQMYSLQRTATATSTMTEYRWMQDRQVLMVFLGVLLLGAVVIGFNETHGLTQDVDLRHLLMLAFVNVFPRGISSVIKGAMLGMNSQARYYIASTLLNLGRPLFLLLALLFFRPAVVTLVVLYVIFSFVEMTAYLILRAARQPAPPTQPSGSDIDTHLLGSLLLSNGVSVVAINLDKILVFISVSLALAGEYTFASAVAGLLYMFVNSAIAAFSPKFKELFIHDEQLPMRLHLYGISFINNVVVLLAIAAFYFTGDYLLQAMSSDLDRANVIRTFMILAAACLLSSNLWIPGAVATSTGRASFNVKTNVMFVVTYLVVFYGFTRSLGQSAFSMSMLLSAIVTTALGLLYFKYRVFQLSIGRYLLVSVVLPLALVGLAIAPLWVLDAQFKLLWLNAGYLAMLGALGLLAWFRARAAIELRFRALLVKP